MRNDKSKCFGQAVKSASSINYAKLNNRRLAALFWALFCGLIFFALLSDLRGRGREPPSPHILFVLGIVQPTAATIRRKAQCVVLDLALNATRRMWNVERACDVVGT
jgi:hypothetical protein